MYSRSITPPLLLAAALAFSLLLTACGPKPSAENASAKPVLLYSYYFNAEGENRYPADGVFSEYMKELETDFEVRVHADPLNEETLSDVKVLLIANPNDKAVEGFPPPHHVNDSDIKTLTAFVNNGGGLITNHNQEKHNLETKNFNRLLKQFGIHTTEDYTEAKAIELSEDTPIIGGLMWAYIIGNSIQIDSDHPASPFAIVTNDVSQEPLKGTWNAEGILLAGAEPGKGRVLVITDSGWVLNAALNGEEAGGVVIENHDNREIARKLARWTAGL